MAGPIVVGGETQIKKPDLKDDGYWSDFVEEEIDDLNRVVDNLNLAAESGDQDKITSSKKQLELDRERIYQLAKKPKQIEKIDSILGRINNTDLDNGGSNADKVVDVKEAMYQSAMAEGKELEERDRQASGPDFTVDSTINEPTPVEKEKKNAFNFKSLLGKGEEGPKTVETAPVSRSEEVKLKIGLRSAIDEYLIVMKDLIKTQKELEAKGDTDNEIPRIDIIKTLEDPRLHDPRVPSTVKSRLLEGLNRKLKEVDDKELETKYNDLISRVEPAAQKISDALEAVLATVHSREQLEMIKASLSKLIIDVDETKVHRQTWDAIIATKEGDLAAPNQEWMAKDTDGEKATSQEGMTPDQIGKAEITDDGKSTGTLTEDEKQPKKGVPQGFQEFDTVDPAGEVVKAASNVTEEENVNQKNIITPQQKEILTGEKDKEVEGVVNFMPEDLNNTVEVSQRENRGGDEVAQIKKRIEDQKASSQVQQPDDTSDIFDLGSEKTEEPTLTDVDNNPLAGTGEVITPTIPTEAQQKNESQTVAQTTVKPEEVKGSIISSDKEPNPPAPQIDNKESKEDSTPEVAHFTTESKKSSLFDSFKQILGLGPEPNTTK